MNRTRSIVSRMLAACLACCLCSLALTACGGGGGGGGVTGVYTSVDSDEIKIELKSGGAVVVSMGGEQGQPGTYTIDGEKIILDFNGVKTIFIRDGDCIEDLQHMFGKMCKGGKAGAASNKSTRSPPPTAGTWSATNEDGTFTIEFKPGDKFTFTMTPAPNSQMGDKTMTSEGTFVMEGDTLYTKLSDSTPMALKWVNGAYESMAFGLPMKFTKK